MIRNNPYEAAFEAYLRDHRIAYVSVDESRRALLADVSLKSMDFIVYAEGSQNLLIDVKGRRRLPGRRWENWATVDDIDGLTQWERVFGADFRSLLVFAYESSGEITDEPGGGVVTYQGKRYDFYGVWLDDYRRLMKQRSPSWQTVWMPAVAYRSCRFALETLWSPAVAAS
ncbi:MAG: HYExAFE family protein [Rubinisphaera brasiliensis]|uniref:HYExAFE family protein n=1 Tax=Rubinisphaera brasiliensis TaxID=119 RepID=UPI00391B8792|nr:HYExAFE family protein [bacterium]